MPISRDEFESGELNWRHDVLVLLNANRDLAYSKGELLSLLNFEGGVSSAASRIELARNTSNRPIIASEELDDVLDGLLAEGLVLEKEIRGVRYFAAEMRGPT